MRSRTFHPAELGFLEAIHADPKNDALRLVYADWLEENGQAERAEFIRLQLQHGTWRPSASQLTQREQDLNKAFGWEWAKARHCGLDSYRHYRGLPMPTLYLSRCSSDRLTRLLTKMNPGYRVLLMLEQRKLLLPGETEAIFEHPFMGRVAIFRLLPDSRGGSLDDLLHKLAALPLPTTVERFSFFGVRGPSRLLAEKLFGRRYIVED